MYLEPASRKAFKGSVQIKNSNGRLQLVFSYGGKSHYLSTGFVDSAANRRLAEFKAQEIEKDILYERFDPTLSRYKPKSALSTLTPITPIATPKPSLAELWEKFSKYKRPQCSPNTMKFKYAVFTNYLKQSG